MEKQINAWSGEFGTNYTNRNLQTIDEMEQMYKQNFGATRTEMNALFLDAIPKDAKILEVGCNIGNQLETLRLAGFKNLYGIDLQEHAIEVSRGLYKNLNTVVGSGFDIPFKSLWFDMVFTSGVLIHIHPNDCKTIMKEITRCSKKWVWGFEYYANQPEQVEYRGKKELLWRGDFAGKYAKDILELVIVKREKFKYSGKEIMDEMFLLERKDVRQR